MTKPPQAVRPAGPLEDQAAEIAEATTQALFEANPEWRDRWGDEGRASTRHDLEFTVTFLAAALRESEDTLFVDYVDWLRTVLVSRGVPEDVIRRTHDELANQLEERFPADEARRAIAVLEAGKAVLGTPIQPDSPQPLDDRGVALVDALLEGDGARAREVLDEALDGGMEPTEATDELMAPALREVGRRWELAEVSVADEHLATATARSLLASLFTKRELAPEMGGHVLLACVENCQHGLGLQMVADAFEEEGWTVRYLGEDVPVDALVAYAADERPDVLCLSVSMPQQISAARASVQGVREALGDESPWILLGGLVMNRFPRLGDIVGADSWASTAGKGTELARDLEPPGEGRQT